MDVDTSEFADLAAQVAALSRKISTLSGRVTMMGRHVQFLDRDLSERHLVLPPPPPPRARHARPRHLRVVR